MTLQSASPPLMFLSALIVLLPISVVAESAKSQTPLGVLGTKRVGTVAVRKGAADCLMRKSSLRM